MKYPRITKLGITVVYKKCSPMEGGEIGGVGCWEAELLGKLFKVQISILPTLPIGKEPLLQKRVNNLIVEMLEV